jgi:hypothetical protein
MHPPSTITTEPKTPRPAPPKNRALIIIMVTCIALLAANLAIFGWRYYSPTDIKITYPYDGAIVGTREMVRGNSSRILKGEAPWVVVYSQVVGRYYPQNDPPDVQANGDWSSLTFIDVEEDVGPKFDIRGAIE